MEDKTDNKHEPISRRDFLKLSGLVALVGGVKLNRLPDFLSQLENSGQEVKLPGHANVFKAEDLNMSLVAIYYDKPLGGSLELVLGPTFRNGDKITVEGAHLLTASLAIDSIEGNPLYKTGPDTANPRRTDGEKTYMAKEGCPAIVIPELWTKGLIPGSDEFKKRIAEWEEKLLKETGSIAPQGTAMLDLNIGASGSIVSASLHFEALKEDGINIVKSPYFFLKPVLRTSEETASVAFDGSVFALGGLEIPPSLPSTPTPEPTATPEAPVQETITFELTDGGSLEMLKFNTPEEAIDYITRNTYWRTGSVFSAYDSWLNSEEAKTFIKELKKIPDWKAKRGKFLPYGGEEFFILGIDEVSGGLLLEFTDRTNINIVSSVFIPISFSEFDYYLTVNGKNIQKPLE